MNKQVKGKAIIGIAIAVIMLATLMAMIPAVSAKDVSNQYLTLREPANLFMVNPAFVAIEMGNTTLSMMYYQDFPTDSVKIGQELIFNNTERGDVVLIEGIADTNTDGEAFSASAFVTEAVPKVNGVEGNDKTVEGIYFDTTSMGRTGTYILSCKTKGLKQALSVSRPIIPIELKVGPDVVSTITVGTKLKLDCSGISDLDPYDCVDLEITDPDGRQIKTWTAGGVTQYYDEINVRKLIEYGSSDVTKQIDTTDWLLGPYSFHVITEEENARGLDLASATKTLGMLKGEVDIDIDKTEVGELESVTVTVTGIYGNIIHVEATAGEEYVEFEEGLNDFKDTFNRLNTSITDPVTGKTIIDLSTGMPETHVYGFDVPIEEDGQMDFSARFYDTGAYTIEVIDYGKDGIRNTADDEMDEDSEDVKVAEKDVTFDMPSTVVIGEDLEIRGTTNAGDYIDIAVDDYIVYTSIPVEADMTFEEDLITPETRGTGAPGTIIIEAFIRVAGDPVPDIYTDITDREEDGQTSILLTAGSLTVDLSATGVAQEDEFKVEGTAEGSDFVDIITIAPKGGSGRGINPGSIPSVPGISRDSSAVSDIDYSYLKDLYVDEDADTGKYLVIVVSPGRNGVYDEINDDHLFGAEFEDAYGPIVNLGAKTQGQILSIVMDATVEAAGSDDLIFVASVNIETPMVGLDPITGVGVGEPMLVTGVSNREEGYTIILTARAGVESLTATPGEYEELPPATVPVENGTFEATFDTTTAVAGLYIVIADDGDGHTDEFEVEITAAGAPPVAPGETPTPVPTVVPAVEPAAVPTATPEATAAPTESPKPAGFEFVFAIAGFLAVAYLVHRRKN